MRNTKDRWSLEEILDHPELAKSNPELMKTEVGIRPGSGGAYTKYGGIELGAGAVEKPGTLIHEIQHGLQESGGLSKGGSPGILSWASPDQRKELLRIAKKNMAEWKPATYEQFWGKDVTKEGLKAYSKYLDDFKKTTARRWAAVQEGAPRQVYKNLAGEFEARDAASRMNLTPEQRITTPPYSSENIPVKDLIVR